MSNATTLLPIGFAPLRLLRKNAKYQLDMQERIVLKDGARLLHSQLHSTSVIKQHRGWVAVLKIATGPLLALGKPGDKDTATNLASQVTRCFLLDYTKDGESFLRESRCIFKRVTGNANLYAAVVDDSSLYLPLEINTSRGPAFAELVAERGGRFTLFNGLGRRQDICKTDSIKQVDSELAKGEDGQEFRVFFRGSRRCYASVSTPLTQVRKAAVDQRCRRLDEIVGSIRRFLHQSQPPGRLPPSLKEDLFRRLDGR